MKRLIRHGILAGCLLATGGCTRPSDAQLRADFQKAFGVPLPSSFSVTVSQKTLADFFGDYGLYAVISFSREDFAALDRSLASLPRVEKEEAIEVTSYADVVPYFRNATAIIQTQTSGSISRCALLPERNVIAFTIDNY